MSPRFKCPECKASIAVPPGRAMRDGDPCPNPDCPGMAPNGRNPVDVKQHRRAKRAWRQENAS